MFIFAYGAQVAYMVIIGDTIPIVLRNAYGDEGNLPSREFIMSMFSIFIILLYVSQAFVVPGQDASLLY